jgi:hypothetical protein
MLIKIISPLHKHSLEKILKNIWLNFHKIKKK